MTTTMWKGIAVGDYIDPGNWSSGVPGPGDTASFGASGDINISLVTNTAHSSYYHLAVNDWSFSSVAPQYNFEIGLFVEISFLGGGIELNGGSANFYNFGEMQFQSGSADKAFIFNFNDLAFLGTSTAGSSLIDTVHGEASFVDFTTGGSAQFITDAGGVVDFSGSSGPGNDHRVSAGSIAGAGFYQLGSDQLTIGSNGLSTTVSGPVSDGGLYGGTGASLVKVGPGTLTLSHAGNTYSGGTTLEGGTLDVAAVGAAGTGPITFAGRAKLKIENAALSARHFTNPIENFGKHNILDLTGLHFHAGATATYHRASHHLTVDSGSVIDTLTLLSLHGMHFEAVSDHHGGTDVFLLFA